ncbi:MAG: hypothetical protein U0350_36385 [Caldilineaceae bacterium]
MLLDLFPGRFLEEIDERVDWGRLQRALAARRIREVETIRLQNIQGIIKYEHMSDADLRAITEHDELVEAWQTKEESGIKN